MGFLRHRPRRRGLGAAASLALVLALAGSTSPMSRSVADGEVALSAAPADDQADQPSASYTVVDPRRSAPVETVAPEPAVRIAVTGTPAGTVVQADLADVLLKAYRSAVAGSPESCHLPVSLLAAIGQVESGSLVGRPVDAQHRTAVFGPVLDGNGFAAIPDTDHGAWDGDTRWDRAVGPMQFIPSSWRMFGVDADGDGIANPQDVEDAAASTAAYLCYGGRDLTDPAALRSAVLSYNHSAAYLRLVLTYQARYAGLGLDAGTSIVGLPTSIVLDAVPVTGPYGGPVAGPVAGPNAGPAAGPSARPTGWEVGAVAGHRKRTPTAKASASARSSAATPSRAPAPTGSPSGPSSGSPSGTPSGSPSGTPSGTPSPGTPSGTPSGSPSDPSSGTPSGSPSDPSSGSPSTPAPEPPSTPTPPAPTCPTAPATPTDPTAPACDPCTPAQGSTTDPAAGPTGAPCPPADPSTTASTSSAP
jgi:hypothetical protein